LVLKALKLISSFFLERYYDSIMGKNMARKHKKNFLLEVPFVFFLVILITLSPNIAVWLGFENGPFVKEASAQQVELLTTSGTWTAPANVYEVTVEAWGAGGGVGMYPWQQQVDQEQHGRQEHTPTPLTVLVVQIQGD
jgi:hypothetical protein